MSVSLFVRETPCAAHPDEEWLIMSVDGHVIMELCTGALKAMANMMRGKDLIQLQPWLRPASEAEEEGG